MAISISGTFDYVVEVPDAAPPWPARLRKPVISNGDGPASHRLVGHEPFLDIADAGLASTPQGIEPSALARDAHRSRLTLVARDTRRASSARASFHVDRDLGASLRPRDRLHLVRAGDGGLGISVLRDGKLIAAAGAVTEVPLDNDFEANIVSNMKPRAGSRRRPDQQKLAVEVKAAGAVHILAKGELQIGPFMVFMFDGPRVSRSGGSESVSITRIGLCDDAAARSTAMLLRAGVFDLVRPEPREAQDAPVELPSAGAPPAKRPWWRFW